ncbi:MAG: putative bifunctional diguanylate cyclase/phosphodiesterase [Betaproteobacteria bacterium]
MFSRLPLTRLGLRLLVRLLIISAISGILLSTLFGFMAWREQEKAQEARLQEIRQNVLTPLAADLWQFDDARVTLQVEMIGHMLPGSGVRLDTIEGRQFVAGRPIADNGMMALYRIPLVHPGSPNPLGTLTIGLDSVGMQERVRQAIENDILIQLAFIALFVMALSRFIQRLVVHRLAILSKFAHSLDLDTLEESADVPVPMPEGGRHDEIDDLAETLERMRQRILADMRASRTLQEELVRRALHDPLTSLGNRAHLSLRATAMLANSPERGLAFAFIDVDRLKLINDTLGHMVGDHLLRAMAERMAAVLPERVELFRPGSDEFLLLIPEPDAAPNVREITEKIQAIMAASFEIEHHEIPITISIGAAVAPEHGGEQSLLLRHADIALQAAKRQGRGNTCFFSPALLASLNERVQLESFLRGALDRNEFEVYYQPQIELGSGRLTGAEALLRWRHGEQGNIGPDRFIPVAEDSGQIIAIGAWVLRTACREARAWQDEGLLGLTLSVNLSSVQLRHSGLMAIIREALEETGLEGRQLEVEITESVIMNDVHQASECLQALRDLGIQVAIDDFGTGYSSMAYLKHLPIDRLKIDRAFITDIPTDANDTAIAIAVIRLAEALNLTVIAEGVENVEQAGLLLAQGCPSAQGYYFARPMPASEFREFARANIAAKGAASNSHVTRNM